jgi:hypothetical protein
MKEVCLLPLRDLLQPINPDAMRSHTIRFAETTEINGFQINPDESRDAPWQLGVKTMKDGRIHGFWKENVFHVVWLDPEHKLYSRD